MNDPVVSIAGSEVFEGKEKEFLALAQELFALIRRKDYGTDQLLQDLKNPRMYYDIRFWTSTEAAERCHRDPEVHALWAQLDRTMKLIHLVGLARLVRETAEPRR